MNRLLLLIFLPIVANSYQLNGKIIKVIDGDTVTLLTSDLKQHKIRLGGIDAPEKKQPYGNKSKQLMAELVAGKQATAECTKKDFYKRDLCTIYVDNLDINAEMLKRGSAWVFRKYYKGGKNYYEFESSAKSEQLGLWNTSEYQSIPPWEWRKQHKKK